MVIAVMSRSTWEFIPKTSYLQFKVKFLRISQVTGYFQRFTCRVEADPEFANADISALIDAGSVQTYYEEWDEKMQSPLFFATDTWPQFDFRAVGGCRVSSGNVQELDGWLTIRDVTQKVTLVISFVEVRMNKRKPTALFRLYGTIRRSDYGLKVPNEGEVGDDVSLTAEIALIMNG